ncbi:MAG TPA: hypothetical protein VFE61_20865 [Candidatus Sulfotelmatobacter sp.]|nr:hypothetical protein [Candidatus Sulfotelmatobacter sp.]
MERDCTSAYEPQLADWKDASIAETLFPQAVDVFTGDGVQAARGEDVIEPLPVVLPLQGLQP